MYFRDRPDANATQRVEVRLRTVTRGKNADDKMTVPAAAVCITLRPRTTAGLLLHPDFDLACFHGSRNDSPEFGV